MVGHYCVLLATPAVVWLVFAGHVRAATKSLPLSPDKWPLWEMAAATIAFLAWAFALQGSPLTSLSWYSSAFAGFMILVVQVGLGLMAPVFQQPLST